MNHMYSWATQSLFNLSLSIEETWKETVIDIVNAVGQMKNSVLA